MNKRITQLNAVAELALNMVLPFDSGLQTEAKKGTIQQLVDFISDYIEGGIAGNPGDYQGTATPSTTPVGGSPSAPVYYFAGPGTYTNFGGVVLTSPLNILSWDGSSASVFPVPINLDGYQTIAASYPNYLANKNYAFSTKEKQIINAISVLDFKVPDAHVDDVFEIGLLGTIITPPGYSSFKYVVAIVNVTRSLTYVLVNDVNLDVSLQQGIKFYSGGVYPNGSTTNAITFNLSIDWTKLPETFDYLPTIGTGMKIMPGYREADSYIYDELITSMPYILKKKATYTENERLFFKAVKTLDFQANEAYKDAEWEVLIFKTVSSNFPDFKNALFIRNVTNNEIYGLVNNPNETFSVKDGIYTYSGIITSNSNNKNTYLRFVVQVDWNVLPANYEIFYSANGTGLKLRQSINEAGTFGLLSSKLSYNGKKQRVLWLGTSIPQESLYPEYSCLMNNAVCINQAKGASRAAAEIPANLTTYTNISFPGLFYSLAHTRAEKQQLIDNYATIKPGLSEPSGPATLSPSDKTDILNSSYETKLVPYLDGTLPKPDLIVFDHGYNDQYGPYYIVPAVRNDRRIFIGAINYMVDVIFSYDPYMKVAIFGHYEDKQDPFISVAQETLANYWSFPLCKVWKDAGFSNQLIGSTTVKNTFMPDQVHPFSDTTGNAQRRLSKIASNFLKGIL